jgi:hypothetical protein
MNISQDEKSKLIFALSLISGIDIDGYKLKSIDLSENDKCFIFVKGDNEKKIAIEEFMKMKTMDKPNENELSITSSEIPKRKEGVDVILSETSEINNDNKQKPMTGGFNFKNIFQKSKYSETSSIKMSETSNYSQTSTELFNGRSDNYSDTSVIGQIGGNLMTTDTFADMSDLKQRKVSKSENYLDMGIFKKVQSGGSAENLRKKMNEVGINSNSSTSSICE